MQRREARHLSERGRSAKVTSRASVCRGAALASSPENCLKLPPENCLGSTPEYCLGSPFEYCLAPPFKKYFGSSNEFSDPTDLLALLSSLSLLLSRLSEWSTSSANSFAVSCPEVFRAEPGADFRLMFRERRRVRSTCVGSKTSPQAKRQKPSILITSLTILTFITS